MVTAEKTIQVRFKLEKETKNTYRFAEIDETDEFKDWSEGGIVVGTVYVNKKQFSAKPSIIVGEFKLEG